MSVSVVIPTLNEANHLPALLCDLRAGGDLVAAVIVADGGSTDATLACAAGAMVVAGSPGRGGQLRPGAAAASTPWVWLLHADSRLPDGWPAAVRACLEYPERAWYARLRFASADPRARLLEAGVALRCALLRLPYGDQGLLIHRALLDAIGGIPEVPLMEDVVLARRLRRHLRPMRLAITTDDSAYVRDGWLRRALSNLWRLGRFWGGASATALAARYKR